MNQSQPDHLTFVFEADGSIMSIGVTLLPENLAVDLAVHGKRKFNSIQITRWIEDCAKVVTEEWGVPFNCAWFTIHDALTTLITATGGQQGQQPP